MSDPENPRPSLAGSPSSNPHPSSSHSSDSATLMKEATDDGLDAQANVPLGLDPHDDARAIVRLLQCQFCSLPLQQPVTLPCGNGVCRKCLPEPYKRENITYPMLPDRGQGFICPFEECRQEHAVGDCSNDVTLTKILERVGQEVDSHRSKASDTPTLLEEKLHWRMMLDPSQTRAPGSQTLDGGRLLSTFTMAELGEVIFDSEISYRSLSPVGDPYDQLDCDFFDHLREVARSEMECQVCYALMQDPLTTPCGHTFCRKCVARVLDHSATCPICRRSLTITPGVVNEPQNQRLSALLTSICPDLVAARAEAMQAEDAALAEASKIPLFICTLSYPEMPTFLHIFEPRYRLMIRRAMETNQQFGMVAYNGLREPQGELGNTQFVQYGTLLHIENIQLMPDGRSLIETKGVSRFKVLEHGTLDGYAVGRVERVEDMPLGEEEALEASEVQIQHPPDEGARGEAPLASLSTADIMNISTDFVNRMRSASAPWLSNSVLSSYGNMPEDPAMFPFWFASVLPINEAEKYRLLPTRSVRERLKITAGWVRRVQGYLPRLAPSFD